MQALMFPLSAEELQAKGKELAALEIQYDALAAEKDTKSREFTEALKKLRGQISQLAREIDAEQAEREATEAEAPWQGLMDQALEKSRAWGQRQQAPKRDRTGEYPLEAEKE